MPVFGKLSLERLATCDQRLQLIANAAILITDFSVSCGYRGEQAQNEAYAAGHSRLRYPQSRHNRSPSQAMDLIPWPVDWGNIGRFKALAKIVKKTAADMNIPLDWGGDWLTFKDYPHYELRNY